MPDIILHPGAHWSPSSIVAAIGAADLIQRSEGAITCICWREIQPGDWRPLLKTEETDTQRLAQLIANGPPLRRDAFPGEGKGQSLKKLVTEAHPDLHPSAALLTEERRLTEEGHEAERRLLIGSIGAVRYGKTWQLIRSPLTVGAKSDVVQATQRRKQGLSTPEALAEITAPEWAWGNEDSGDWGLCAEWNHPEQRTNPAFPGQIASPTLARLLTRGIMATPMIRSARGESWGSTELVWPIWTIPLPLAYICHWWGFHHDPTTVFTNEFELQARRSRVPGERLWIRSHAVPISRFLSIWSRGWPHLELMSQIAKILSVGGP